MSLQDNIQDAVGGMWVGDDLLNRKGSNRRVERKGVYGSGELFGSKDAEEHVIYSLLLDPSRVGIMIDRNLTADDFSDEQCAEAYEVALALFDQGKPADLVSLMTRVSPIAGDRLTKIMAAVEPLMFWENSLEELLWAADRRKLAMAATDMIGRLWSNHDITIQEAVADLAVVGRRESGKEDRHITLEGVIPELQERLTMGKHGLLDRFDIPTPFQELNSMLLGGFLPQDLCVLGARASMGKTSLAMDLLLEASKYGMAILFSGEMSRDLVIMRLVSKYSEVPMGRLIEGDVNEEEYAKAMRVMEDLRKVPLIIDDTPGITTSQMQLRIQHTQEKFGKVSLAAQDFFELIGDGQVEGTDKHVRLTNASQRFKDIAKLCGIPMLILTQVHSGTDSRGNKVPTMNDIPWTQTLGQLADKVVMMYSHDYYFKRGMADYDARKAGIMELHVVKNRNGETGQVNIGYVPETFSFFDLSNASKEQDPYGR